MIDFSNVVVINVLVQFMDLSYMIPRIEVTIKLICFPPPRPRLFQLNKTKFISRSVGPDWANLKGLGKNISCKSSPNIWLLW